MTLPTSVNTLTTDETTAICNTFQEYAKVFENLKPMQVLKYYHSPAMLIKTGTKPKTFSNPITGFALFFFLMQDLRKKNYDHSEMSQLSVKQLSADLALVSGQASRINKSDEAFETFSFTYTMRKTSQGWKIIVATIHDPGSVLNLGNECQL